MKAARYYGPGDVRIDQIPEPIVKDGQLKIRIAWNGICGSDLHAYLAMVPKFPTTTEPNELTGETLPITLGHEFSGTVVELGNGVDEAEWKVGQNVVVAPVFGIGGGGGGLAQYIAVDTRYVHCLPVGVSLEVGAMTEPLAVAYYAVKKSGFEKGKSVLIVGAGPIGLFLLKVLRSIDPLGPIFISEPALLRRELALKHGATLVIDPLTLSESGSLSPTTVPSAVLKATNGLGVDIAFEAAGIQASVDAALQSLRPQGTFVNVAIWEFDPKISMNLVLMKELNVTGTMAYNGIHPELLEAVAAGRISGIEEFITRKISLEDVVEQGFLTLLHEKETQVKILVHP